MDAVTAPDHAAKNVDVALAELQKSLKGLEHSAGFARLSGDPAAESLTALWQVLAGMGALMHARQAERAEVAAAVARETKLVVDQASAEMKRRSFALVEHLGPGLARAAERYTAARLWSIKLRTLIAAGVTAVALAAGVFAVSYGAGYSNGRASGLLAGKTIASALAVGPAGATAWSRLMANNDPVAALKTCKSERDGTGRRFCRMPVWLDPPSVP